VAGQPLSDSSAWAITILGCSGQALSINKPQEVELSKYVLGCTRAKQRFCRGRNNYKHSK
jgi:hypothetical protein